MKKVVFYFVSILSLGIIASCSSDSDGGGDGDDSGIEGKWYYYKTGYVTGGEEFLSDYANDCGEDYIQLNSNGTLKEVWFYDDGSGCLEDIDESGTWTKDGNSFAIYYDGELDTQGEIQTLNSTTLKVYYDDGNVAEFKRTLEGTGGNPGEAYAGDWSGTFTGDDTGTFDVTINANGTITGSGYSNSYSETFSLSGSINSNGQFSAGSTSTGASFTGTVSGNSMSGNWNNTNTGDSGTFSGTKQ